MYGARTKRKRIGRVAVWATAAVFACLAIDARAACTGSPANKTCTGTTRNAVDGVSVTSSGYDTVGVTVDGSVAGATGAGIAVTTDIGYSQIDIMSGSTVSGATGVQIKTNGGYGTLTNNGTIIGTSGAGLSLDLGKGTEDINNNGSISGATGTAIEVKSGTVTLNNNANGVVDGAVVGNDATTVNNFGEWKNAAGTRIGTLTTAGKLTLSTTGTGTMTVTGDAKFGSVATTTLNIAANGASDKIIVKGDTTVAGGTLFLHALGTGFTKGMRYTIMTTDGVMTGTFDAVGSDLPKFLPILAQNGKDLTVTLAQYDYRDWARTRNQLAAASMIAQAPFSKLTAAGKILILGLDAATVEIVQAGLTQIAGDGLTAAKSIALRQGSMFLETLAEQQAFWRSRESVDPNGITFMPKALPAAPSGPGWYTGQPRPALPPRAAPLPADRTFRMWLSGFGSDGRTTGDARDGSAAQRGHTAGGAVGVDLQLGRNTLLGVAGGYSIGAFNVDDRKTSGQNDGFHVAMYSAFEADGFYGSANAGYTRYSTTTSRTVAAGLAPSEQVSGAFDSNEFRVRVEAGKRLDLGAGSITAFTAVQGATLTSNPYVESSLAVGGAGGLFALAFAQKTTTSVPLEIGFRAATRLRMGAATLAPWLQVAYVHEFTPNRTNQAYLAVFPGTPQTVYGARDARNTLRLKGGAQLSISPRAALFVSAEADLATTQKVYAGRGGFRYGW